MNLLVSHAATAEKISHRFLDLVVHCQCQGDSYELITGLELYLFLFQHSAHGHESVRTSLSGFHHYG